MKRKLLKIAIGAVVAVLVLAGAGFLFLDEIFRRVAEYQIRSQTGMDAHVGKVKIGLATPTITIQDLVLKNNARFGGGAFLVIKEIRLEYDLNSVKKGKLRLPLLEVNVAEVDQVFDEKGASNLDEIGKKELEAIAKLNKKSQKNGGDINLDGVDRLVLTLGKGRTIYLNHPELNQEVNFGVDKEVFSQVNSENDVATLMVYLALKEGGSRLADYFAGSPAVSPPPPPPDRPKHPKPQ
jgi:hypothetical protein